jgi:hypothetical protein
VPVVDGDHEWTTADQVTTIDLTAGSRVFARFQRGPAFFPGMIVRRDGERISIEYDDGKTEDTTISFVRIRRGH